jgi:8-oxo-dGTP pyrophosphatase MutT (NUDIX family)
LVRNTRQGWADLNSQADMSYSDPIPLDEGITTPPPPVAFAASQVAALCWRLRKGRVQVLLVTSRETRRWVLPKGWPMLGLGPEVAAAREAWEEAGVEGKISVDPIGCYGYQKILHNRNPMPCSVQVFPLRVQTLKSSFPERKERRRKWFKAEEATHLVAEPELAELLLRLSETPEVLAPSTKRAKAAT